MAATPPPRLHVLLARQAPIGVVLRRGPSKCVELIRWDREHDGFDRGAWFHGRVYERRCDLSPDGGLLVYFAADYASDLGAWTGVSKPPWLTALALWPKGDTYGGGGLFTGDRTLWLNHDPGRASDAHPDHLPVGLEVTTSDEGGGGGDFPIFAHRLRADGWTERAYPQWKYGHHGALHTMREGHWEKAAAGRWCLTLKVKLEASEMIFDYRLADRDSDSEPLDAEWADWDDGRGLVYAANGRIIRRRLVGRNLGPPVELIDLSHDTPTRQKAPQWARSW